MPLTCPIRKVIIITRGGFDPSRLLSQGVNLTPDKGKPNNISTWKSFLRGVWLCGIGANTFPCNEATRGKAQEALPRPWSRSRSSPLPWLQQCSAKFGAVSGDAALDRMRTAGFSAKIFPTKSRGSLSGGPPFSGGFRPFKTRIWRPTMKALRREADRKPNLRPGPHPRPSTWLISAGAPRRRASTAASSLRRSCARETRTSRRGAPLRRGRRDARAPPPHKQMYPLLSGVFGLRALGCLGF